jgi:hypothetical protein
MFLYFRSIKRRINIYIQVLKKQSSTLVISALIYVYYDIQSVKKFDKKPSIL